MTDFHAILRSNARELTRDQIDSMSRAQAQAYYWTNKDVWKSNKPKDERKTICFTGFLISEKDALNRIANDKGFKVVETVIRGLDYLVTGPNAGPSKLKKAQEQKTRIIGMGEFISL